MGFESASPAKGLEVRKNPRYLCFEFCSDSDIPVQKNQVKKVIAALKRFSNEQAFIGARCHDLGSERSTRKTQELMRQYPGKKLWSMDVGHPGGDLGQYRLVFYRELSDTSIAKIVALFIDTH